MNPRVEFLTVKLKGYLERRTMPRGLADKPKAQEAELGALIHCLTRYAPRQEFGEWWAKMESRLAENSETRAWPTEGEIKKAAMSLRGTQTKQVAEGDEIDPLVILSGRMERGEHVGDGCLYGRVAVDMLARGLVTHDTLRKYRSGLYFRLKKVYGEEKAREMEAELIQRQEDAEALSSSAKRYSAPAYEPKRIPAMECD